MSTDPKNMPDTQTPTPTEDLGGLPKAKGKPGEHLAQYRWTKETRPISTGRPPGQRDLIRSLSKDGKGAEFFETLVDLSRNARKEQVRLDASKYLIERIWGKTPEVSVTLDANAGQLSPDILETLARALLPSSTKAPDLIEGELVNTSEEAKIPESLDKPPSSE